MHNKECTIKATPQAQW